MPASHANNHQPSTINHQQDRLNFVQEKIQMGVTRCFDIGGSKIVSADVSELGDVDEINRQPTPVSSFAAFSESLESCCPNENEPISIAIAGVIHPETGVVDSSNIPCISGRPLANDLSRVLDRNVTLINDANAFALAEARFGKARNHDVVLGIILGTGVGGGIVINGKVLHGSHGTAGEWGHGPASTLRTGHRLPQIKCSCCQQTCVDTLGGARGLERLYYQITSNKLSSESILQAWESSDSDAIETVDVWLDIVGSALANVVNILGPSIVAVGGGLANNGRLIKALGQEVSDRCLAELPSLTLYPAVSGPEQGLIGAALFAKNNLQPTMVPEKCDV